MKVFQPIYLLREEECSQLIGYAHEKEKDLQERFPEFSEMTDEQKASFEEVPPITTAYYNKYNLFNDNPQYVDRFIEVIKRAIPSLKFPIAVQAWVNIYRENEGISWHDHSGLQAKSFAANIFLGGATKPGTNYEYAPDDIRVVENKVGYIQIIDNTVRHMVEPNISGNNRYSIGLTIHDFAAIDEERLSTCALNSDGGTVIMRAS